LTDNLQFAEWRKSIRLSGQKLVVTNGCFDLLHVGHIQCLVYARQQGDLLLVGVNGDEAVECLKGPGRPINSEEDRALVVASLKCVDRVYVFPQRTATEFLFMCQPEVYVKGGDYSLETMNPEERDVLEECGAKILFFPTVNGKSTSTLSKKIAML
jgi:D-beta-D-heptose 7-phosphate kinase/D-beta-D-heptose 1-phosphate adenosyltransferase